MNDGLLKSPKLDQEAMSDVAKGELLWNITAADVLRVYSGRPGCGCGCRGNYSDNKSAKTRMLNELRNHAPLGEIKVINGLGEDGLILSWETETRYRWVYLRKAA